MDNIGSELTSIQRIEDYSFRMKNMLLQNMEKYYFMGILKNVNNFSELDNVINLFSKVDEMKTNTDNIFIFSCLDDITMILNNLPIYSFHDNSLIINYENIKSIIDIVNNELDFLKGIDDKNNENVERILIKYKTSFPKDIESEKDDNILITTIHESICKVINECVNDIINKLKENELFMLYCKFGEDENDDISYSKNSIHLINSLLLYSDYIERIITSSNVKKVKKTFSKLDENRFDDMYIFY